jgi:hypothetical protein
MVTYSQKTGPRDAVKIEIPYNVAGANDMRNASRSKFEPLEATVTFRNGRVWAVRFRGRRHNEHRTWTDATFIFDDNGAVRETFRNPEVPPIVDALIEDASRHPAVIACQSAAAAA